MATFKHVDEWYTNNEDLIRKYVDDPEKILTSQSGKRKGAYLVSVKLIKEGVLIPMYAGEAGADAEHDRCIADRLKEHIRIWFGTYTEYWTGVKNEELESGKVKLHLHIVGEAEELEERKRMEAYTIMSEKPYLQYGPYKKYPTKYAGLDLCIIPWENTRRQAFLSRLAENGIIWEEKRMIDCIWNKDFKPDWDKCAIAGKEKKEIADVIRSELQVGTKEYKAVKALVDEARGFVAGSRGCTYPYIIRVLSHALIEYQTACTLV